MTLVSSLNIAQQALAVNQAAITVVSNNISNVNNENYSKLRANLSEVVNYSASVGNPLSYANSLSGVSLSSITRYSDAYLQNYYWQENSEYSYLQQYSSIASSVEDIMNELNDTGLSDAISEFYEAVDALNDDPSDITARQNYVSAAENVCYIFNSVASDTADLQTSLVGDYNVAGSVDSSDIADSVNKVNSLLDQLADINDSVLKTSAGGIASSAVLDKRDAIITSLTELIPVNISENQNGTVNISLGSNVLVNGSGVKGYLDVETGTSTQPAVINIVDPKDNSVMVSNVNDSVTAGSIGAILDACSQASSNDLTINGVLSQLNTLASTFAAIMNTIQTGDPSGDNSVPVCLTSDGSQLTQSTENIFTSSTQSSSTATQTRATASGDKAGTTIATTTDEVGNATTTITTMTLNSSTGMTTIKTTTVTGVSAKNLSVNSDVADDPNLVAAGRLTAEEFADFDKYKSSIGDNTNSTLMADTRDIRYAGLGNLTIERYLSNTVADIGTKTESIDLNLETQNSVLSQIKSNLTSETAVNMDEELVDLIKYQRAYQAAARVFNICNELIENLVNLGN